MANENPITSFQSLPKDTTYNGWKNYETWLLNIWWDSAFTEDANECSTVDELADRIKSIVEESIEEQTPANGFVVDLVNAALSEIDWYEIAEHYQDDLKNVEEEEDHSCNQCQALMINGVYCHETGCPNTHKVKVDGEWVRDESEGE